MSTLPFRVPRGFVLLVIILLALAGMAALRRTGPAAQAKALPAKVDQIGAGAKKPNVLIILADDLGWSDIGCYGSEVQTPNIDALAAGGLRFTEFYNAARCSPSRASLLTGLDSHEVGVPLLATPLNDRCVTLAEALKPAGYSTYMVGKWHLSEQVTPTMRGFDEFYGMLGGFNSYWQEHPYYTRLPADHPKHDYPADDFYSTNAFGDYALDFMNEGREAGKPWFLYLAFQAAHFPLGAPEAVIGKYEAMYRTKGWDAIRAERLARQKKLGLVPESLALTPRSVVPANFINTRTGWADKQNPAWNTLSPERQGDLARRMAVYAAAIDVMDQNIGRVVAHLKETGEWNNTVIFFLSDNGACAEWDPYGFDKLDSPLNILHTGADLKKVGGPDSYVSYGSGWANVGNTPWRLYKHYEQEGGIRTPMIVHWPDGLKTRPGATTAQVGSVVDFMPTVLQLCGATYPETHNDTDILPLEGESLVPMFTGQTLPPRTLYQEHEGNRMMRQDHWKLVALADKPWELYDLARDPTEMHDLAGTDPARVKTMAADWEVWAGRSHVTPLPSPQVAGQTLDIRCDVTPRSGDGVVLAQGGRQRGYALYLKAGKAVFGVREADTLYTAAAPEALPKGRVALQARLAKDGAMTLSINGKVVAQGKAPGVITQEPQDALSIGEDAQSAVGDYDAPNPLKGRVENIKITAGIKTYVYHEGHSPAKPLGKTVGLSEGED